MKLEWNLDFPLEASLLSRMQAAADKTLQEEGIPFPCYASVRICGDPEIRALNAAWRKQEPRPLSSAGTER